MASGAFLKAAKTPGSLPVVLFGMEDPEAETFPYSTKTQWDGSLTLTNIDTDEIVGSATHKLEDQYSWMQTATPNNPITPTFDSYISDLTVYGLSSSTIIPEGTNGRVKITRVSDSFVFYSEEFPISAPYLVGSQGALYGNTYSGQVRQTILLETTETYTFDAQYFSGGSWNTTPGTTYLVFIRDLGQTVDGALFVVKPTAQVVTTELSVFAALESTFNSFDTVLSGSSLVYTAFGGNSIPPAIDLGTISDGGTLPPYDYYAFQLDYTSLNGERATCQEVSVTTGERVVISSLAGQPNKAARPLLLPSNSSFNVSSITRTKGSAIGKAQLNVLFNKYISNFIATGFLRGKAIAGIHGFEGLAESEYESLFTGVIEDVSHNQNTRSARMEFKSILDRFKKTKIPIETVDASGVKNTQDFVISAGQGNDNIIQAMLDIIDEVGVQDRFIDTITLESLRDGLYAADDWKVERTIYATDPQGAFDLLVELSIIAGGFLLELPNGKITFIPYDDVSTPTTSIDLDKTMPGDFKNNLKDLRTKQLVYHDVKAGVTDPGNNEDDYDSLELFINASAEIAWDTEGENRIFDKWSTQDLPVHLLVLRLDSWFANPRPTISVAKLPMRYIETNPGHVIGGANVQFPVPEAEWPGIEDDRKFLVMTKQVLPFKGMINFDLMEIEAPDVHFANTMVVTNAASYTGTVDDLQELDSTYVQINEAAAQMWSVELTFTIHPDSGDVLKYLDFNGHYQGSPSHVVRMQVWDVNASSPAWVNLGTFESRTNDIYRLFLDGLDAGYIDQSSANEGDVKFRIYHESNGSAGHIMFIDRMRLVARTA